MVKEETAKGLVNSQFDDEEETEVMETLESLVDSVMEAASEVREFIQANSGTLSEEKEEYMKHVDGKMNYILSELF